MKRFLYHLAFRRRTNPAGEVELLQKGNLLSERRERETGTEGGRERKREEEGEREAGRQTRRENNIQRKTKKQ